MEKSTILDKKLLNYVSASAAMLATGAAANAQVIYTDITPDDVISNTQNSGAWQISTIDFNNDAIMDFMVANNSISSGPNFSVAVPYATGSSCAGGNPNNEILGSMPSNYNYVHKLAMNDAIGTAGPWLGTNCVQGTLGYRTSGGASPYGEEWNNGVTDGYMGVKFEAGGNIYYGWARMDVSADQLTVTIKDYAYESAPNTPILAGDMGASAVSEVVADQVAVYNNNNQVTVKVKQELTNGMMQVLSSEGRIVKEFAVNNGTQVFDLNDVAAGLYVVNVTFEEGVLTQKIAIN